MENVTNLTLQARLKIVLQYAHVSLQKDGVRQHTSMTKFIQESTTSWNDGKLTIFKCQLCEAEKAEEMTDGYEHLLHLETHFGYNRKFECAVKFDDDQTCGTFFTHGRKFVKHFQSVHFRPKIYTTARDAIAKWNLSNK